MAKREFLTLHWDSKKEESYLVRHTEERLTLKQAEVTVKKNKKVEGNGGKKVEYCSMTSFGNKLNKLYETGEVIKVQYTKQDGTKKTFLGKIAKPSINGCVYFTNAEIELGFATHSDGSNNSYTTCNFNGISTITYDNTTYHNAAYIGK